jgi:CheY-like chemotaxis protein
VPPLERILCVEDDADIKTVIQIALETVGGFRVELCGSGLDALDRAVAWQPDLILLDVMMPGMDGPSTLRALQAQPATAAIPVMFMTARVQPSEVAEFLAMGALAVIAKPFDPMTLAHDIETHWRRRHAT